MAIGIVTVVTMIRTLVVTMIRMLVVTMIRMLGVTMMPGLIMSTIVMPVVMVPSITCLADPRNRNSSNTQQSY